MKHPLHILESLCHSLPVIKSHIGAEVRGITCKDGTQLLPSDGSQMNWLHEIKLFRVQLCAKFEQSSPKDP